MRFTIDASGVVDPPEAAQFLLVQLQITGRVRHFICAGCGEVIAVHEGEEKSHDCQEKPLPSAEDPR